MTVAAAGDLIATTELGHAYGNVVALHHLDFDVPDGRIGLVGANGAGKSTLIKILLGILKPTAGGAVVLGHDVKTDPIGLRSKVGYMPEGSCLPLSQTAADFTVYAAELAGIPTKAARQRASDVLSLVGLHEERFRYLGEFSTGMKQRAMLAQAIVHDPELVFLDEPTAGLDPEGRAEMLSLIGRLGDFGINVLVSSHVLTDIESTCDWVVMLDGGTVLRTGPIDNITGSDTVDVELLGTSDVVIEQLKAKGASVEVRGKVLRISSEADAFNLIRDVLAETGVGMRRLTQSARTLEDIFLAEGGVE
ncbi:MAG: ABC transporter ATP-binding protein [Acidimicrobiia bacterium]|nr:ABC transporter ATP-binding protein [Acidimicrobiia bacterium]